jgi:hypothetical protein
LLRKKDKLKASTMQSNVLFQTGKQKAAAVNLPD